jgi:ribosomal protein S18 acetylase RimI-like enzyme
MNGVRFPDGYRLETLTKTHSRKVFASGQSSVDDWLKTKALQQQVKRLSSTRVLLDANGTAAGYYTLATGQVDFEALPPEIAKGLPKRMLPVAVLAWLGVHSEYQGRGLGDRLLASALRDCFEAGKTFAFVAVILDCLNDAAKAFYSRFHFRPLEGHPYKLFLSAGQLETMMSKPTTP